MLSFDSANNQHHFPIKLSKSSKSLEISDESYLKQVEFFKLAYSRASRSDVFPRGDTEIPAKNKNSG